MARNSGMRGSGGGGYGSRPHVEKPVRTGDVRKGISPGWVAQRGALVGDHVTHKGQSTGYTGEPRFDGRTGISVPLGNQVALNASGSKAGPGAGRTLYGQSGSQGQHGQPAPGNPPAVPREHIIESFGPTYRKP